MVGRGLPGAGIEVPPLLALAVGHRRGPILPGAMRALRASVVLALFALDRATKLWALRVLRPRGPIRVLPFFDLLYAENVGAAFSLGGAFGRAANAFFIVVSAALTVYILRQLRRWPKHDWWLQAGGLLVVSGALGNLYDRLVYRFVVDFLYLHYWPVFNVADSCITVGACMLAWGLRNAPEASNTRLSG